MKKIYIILALFTLLFSVELVVKPYLQNATPNSIHILWETDSNSLSIVEWGQQIFLSESTTGSSFSNYGSSRIHTVELNNLEPNTKYYYRVVVGDFESYSGLHDFIYRTDGSEVIRVHDISFFTVFTNYNEFDNYDLSVHFGGGTGKLGYDPQTGDSIVETTTGGFLGFNLKTPYFQKNGGLELLMEYDGKGINVGGKLPIISGFAINFGITRFENLSEFATESKTGAGTGCKDSTGWPNQY